MILVIFLFRVVGEVVWLWVCDSIGWVVWVWVRVCRVVVMLFSDGSSILWWVCLSIRL